MTEINKKHITDTIHGQFALNRVEARILETPYYQRLRWIKQLGFTFYVYPGATHTRHNHALGVLNVMDRILHSLGIATTEDKFFNPKAQDEKTQFHRTMRLAAMLHDIGTFPFSHTIELAYINHWRERAKNSKQKYKADHEILGSHILLNTDFDGGITRILKEEGIDPIELSKIISGNSTNIIANQLMHSDVDADRMDYLLRDAYFTGVKLGVYDIDYLIRNMRIVDVNGSQSLVCFKEEALNTVESFLVNRYFWYSQIINDGTSYKFDLIAARIYQYFLENGMAYSFESLMDEVSQNPNEYFTFNDSYFLAKLHEYLAGRITHPMIRELSEMLAQRKPPAQIKIGPLNQSIIENDDHRKDLVKRAQNASEWLKNEILEVDPDAWTILDIPTKDVSFTKSQSSLSKEFQAKHQLANRDSAKILTRQGEAKLLVEVSNSIMSKISQYRNFIPRFYVSPKTYSLLEKKGILKKMESMDFS